MISVGIDISKEKSMVCMLHPYGEVVASPYEVQHTGSDLEGLCERILAFGEEVRVVMEATGTYHLPVLSCMIKAGIFVSVINPLVIKRYAGATLRKCKTDKMDSVKIANYGIDNWFKLERYRLSDEIYNELKILGRQYARYISVKIQSKLALSNILDRTMPGNNHLLRSNHPEQHTKDKLSDFVAEYWHYDNIVGMSEDEFVSDYCRWAKEKGYHRNQAKAKTIYKTACEGIPTLSSSAPSTKMLTLEAVRVLCEINKTLQTILSQMPIVSVLPEYSVVRSMPAWVIYLLRA